jgi:hypothetical protein
MKFLIIGDSWGIGEYLRIDGKSEPIPNTGLEFYLIQLGHIVTNISSGSASNFGQLRHAYWHLREQSDYNYIIWFHTEPIRDIVETVIDDPVDGQIQYPKFDTFKNYADALTYINESNYTYAQKTIYKKFQIPFIVIGGVGRLEDSIAKFSFAKYKIHSWTQELLNLNYQLPRNLMMWHQWPKVFDTFDFDDRQYIIQELESSKNYQDILKQNALFSNYHVIRTEYEKLALRLVEMIK